MPNPENTICSLCGTGIAITDAMRGYTDETGAQRNAHDTCYWRTRAAALQAELDRQAAARQREVERMIGSSYVTPAPLRHEPGVHGSTVVEPIPRPNQVYVKGVRQFGGWHPYDITCMNCGQHLDKHTDLTEYRCPADTQHWSDVSTELASPPPQQPAYDGRCLRCASHHLIQEGCPADAPVPPVCREHSMSQTSETTKECDYCGAVETTPLAPPAPRRASPPDAFREATTALTLLHRSYDLLAENVQRIDAALKMVAGDHVLVPVGLLDDLYDKLQARRAFRRREELGYDPTRYTSDALEQSAAALVEALEQAAKTSTEMEEKR